MGIRAKVCMMINQKQTHPHCGDVSYAKVTNKKNSTHKHHYMGIVCAIAMICAHDAK